MSKVSRPDRGALDKELETLRKTQAEAQAKLDASMKAKSQFDEFSNDKQWSQLLEEKASLRKQRDEARAEIAGALNSVRSAEQQLQQKIKDLNARKPKGPRTEQDLDRQIAQLEAQINQGNLSLVEETKTIKEIGALRATKRQFGGLVKLQAEVDELKTKLGAMRSAIDDSKVKQADAAIAAVDKKLDARKAERQVALTQQNEVYKTLKGHRASVNEARKAIRDARDAYQKQADAWHEQQRQARKEREAEEKAVQKRQERETQLKSARAKVQAAGEPAHAAQIAEAQALLAYFDPSYVPPTKEAEKQTLGTRRAPRQVDSEVQGTRIDKKQPTVEVSRKSRKQHKDTKEKTGKLTLDVSVLKQLSVLRVTLPTSASDLEATKKSLEERIEDYRAQDEREGPERLAAAEKSLKALEDKFAKEDEEEKPAVEEKEAV